MEGYRITRDDSDAVVNGTPLPEVSSQEELRAILAVQRYSRAFDLVIDLVRTRPAPMINEALVLDLSVALFRPSVDAGIVTEDELRGWRSINVGLAGGWRHAPPAHAKVPSLIGVHPRSPRARCSSWSRATTPLHSRAARTCGVGELDGARSRGLASGTSFTADMSARTSDAADARHRGGPASCVTRARAS
jgi:hypothetical protein